MAARLARHGHETPVLYGDLGTDEPAALRTKLFAAAVTSVLGEVIAALCRSYALDTETLWARAAATTRGVYAQLAADADALFGPTLPVKAMTAMRLDEHGAHRRTQQAAHGSQPR